MGGEGKKTNSTTVMSIVSPQFGNGKKKEYTAKCYEEESCFHSALSLINNFIDCSFLVPRASDNVFVIHRDITAKHR